MFIHLKKFIIPIFQEIKIKKKFSSNYEFFMINLPISLGVGQK